MTGAIAQAVSDLHTVHMEEWRAFRAGMDDIEELVRGVLGAHSRGDTTECHRLCKELLDAEHALLGDCYSEPLTELLGYIDPGPET